MEQNPQRSSSLKNTAPVHQEQRQRFSLSSTPSCSPSSSTSCSPLHDPRQADSDSLLQHQAAQGQRPPGPRGIAQLHAGSASRKQTPGTEVQSTSRRVNPRLSPLAASSMAPGGPEGKLSSSLPPSFSSSMNEVLARHSFGNIAALQALSSGFSATGSYRSPYEHHDWTKIPLYERGAASAAGGLIPPAELLQNAMNVSLRPTMGLPSPYGQGSGFILAMAAEAVGTGEELPTVSQGTPFSPLASSGGPVPQISAAGGIPRPSTLGRPMGLSSNLVDDDPFIAENTMRCTVEGCTKFATTNRGLCSSHGGRKKCQVAGCVTTAVSKGLCVAHGGGRRCSYEGCQSGAQTKGLCVKHGGGRRCEIAGCERGAQTGGLCVKHGGGKRCRSTNCENTAQTGGFCVKHGGGRRCSVESCDRSAKSGGLCAKHGGGRRCDVEGCTTRAVARGKCVKHGGRRRCSFPDCDTSSVSRGLCVRHGGGKRCKIPGCSNGAQSGGKCIRHGGGRRCNFEDCQNSAAGGGACIKHGGGMRCEVENCGKSAQGGLIDGHALCARHGGGKRCRMPDCQKPAQSRGLCLHHGGGKRCIVANCNRMAAHKGLCKRHGGDPHEQVREREASASSSPAAPLSSSSRPPSGSLTGPSASHTLMGMSSVAGGPGHERLRAANLGLPLTSVGYSPIAAALHRVAADPSSSSLLRTRRIESRAKPGEENAPLHTSNLSLIHELMAGSSSATGTGRAPSPMMMQINAGGGGGTEEVKTQGEQQQEQMPYVFDDDFMFLDK